MMKQGYFKRILILYLWLGLLGCTDINDSLGFQPKKITTSPYAEDIGFTLVEPVNNSFDVETSFQISGEVNNYSHMDFPICGLLPNIKVAQRIRLITTSL